MTPQALTSIFARPRQGSGLARNVFCLRRRHLLTSDWPGLKHPQSHHQRFALCHHSLSLYFHTLTPRFHTSAPLRRSSLNLRDSDDLQRHLRVADRICASSTSHQSSHRTTTSHAAIDTIDEDCKIDIGLTTIEIPIRDDHVRQESVTVNSDQS